MIIKLSRLLESSLDFLVQVEKFYNTVTVACWGIDIASNSEKIFGTHLTNHEKYRKDIIDPMIGTARMEAQQGFSTMYSQALIMMYSNLEFFIKKLAILYFADNEISHIPEIQKVKIAFSEYMKRDENERLEYLFTEYEKSFQGRMNNGVERFEMLLKPLGLAGPVEAEVAKSILELGLLRNVLAHKAGVVDRQFIDRCLERKLPTDYQIGDTLKISQTQFKMYYAAILSYSNAIVIRMNKIMGRDLHLTQFDTIFELHRRLREELSS